MDNTSPFQPWASDESVKNVKSERDVVDDAKLPKENVNHPKHRQTASYDKDSVAVPSLTPGTSGVSGSGADAARSKESKMDSSKVASMQQIVENTLSQEGRQRVAQLLEAVEALSGAERLLLYLRLPTGVPPHDPLKQPLNPLGSRAELQQTVIWIQTHLEVDPDVSLPKQDVYDEYIAHCMSCNMKPLSTADFGKVMKQVYPTVRPRRLGTRGNSRYCYAGLRKKIKLEVPQLPDLGDSSTEEPNVASKENERVICSWAEARLGVKISSISELARHLMSGAQHAAQSAPAPPVSPPPLTPAQGLAITEEQANRRLLSGLKRKIQGSQGTPGRPKKNKPQELAGESPPSTSFVGHHMPLKHESEAIPGELPAYGYQPYVSMYERSAYPPYPAPRAHPTHSPHPPHPPHSTSASHPPPLIDYAGLRQDPYVFEPTYPRDLTVSIPPDVGHNLPINLSSDASLDLSTERGDWQRRRPPEPPPPRLPLPGKKLILETYQSETRSISPRAAPEVKPVQEEFPRTEYLPKKMRAAEILGGKLLAARQAPAAASPPAPPAVTAEPPIPPEADFLEDPKNLTRRSKSTAAALAREEQEAARGRPPRPRRAGSPADPPDCCGLGGINLKTGVICAEKHSEILNRERVISICNIDKHDLDDYLNEGSSQEHEEELVHYFHKTPGEPPPNDADAPAFLETQDPQDEHSQGKNEKISQLRELLAKNLKNQSGSNSHPNQESQGIVPKPDEPIKATISEGAFKPLVNLNEGDMNGTQLPVQNEIDCKNSNSNPSNTNGTSVPYVINNNSQLVTNVGTPHLYNGHSHNEPQSPTTRTQQYDFVPISDGCHSPGNFHSKSPLGFGARGQSPTKVKQIIMGGSLQTSPISHSTAASPFVSPRNTPVPRSRFCSRPIPKPSGRKRRNPLSLGMTDPKLFAVPNDQKFIGKATMNGPGNYCQPMSAPPSPNILCPQYKNQMYHCGPVPNGSNNNLCLNFLPNQPFRNHMNGDPPLSADPLASEVSQFFQETVTYSRHDAFRSQSVPLKQAMSNMPMLSYNNTPVGSVPPTPIPNEFCDFGSLADTCDLTKAGLNRETLDKIYNAIDSSNDVLSTETGQNILSGNESLNNGCDPLPEQPLLSDDPLTSLIRTGDDLIDRNNQFNQSYSDAATDHVEDFLKRANSMEFEMNDLVDKNKYYTSRSVPSTPLPYKRPAPNLQIDSRRSRELFAADNNYSAVPNGISSKSVPSTPQFVEEKSFFGFSNRDYLINGNSVSGSAQIHETVVESDQGLTSPLHDMLREDMLAERLTPALLADLDKMDGAPYVDL